MKQRLSTYLRQLEAESIHIMREVAAEFRNPVMLYSIGKDSSVMLHLALKAFYPGKPPFPLLHVDTTWKFREMIAFRDQEMRRLGLDLIVHTNEQGVKDGISPITHGSALYTDIMKTEALKQALTQPRLRCGVRRRAARRGEVARQGARVLVPQRRAELGPQAAAAGAVASRQHQDRARREHAGVPAVELDRARRVDLHLSREHSGGAALFRGRPAGGRAGRHADHGRRRAAAARRQARSPRWRGCASARSAAIR